LLVVIDDFEFIPGHLALAIHRYFKSNRHQSECKKGWGYCQRKWI
jgi:hypothetical protein